MLLLAAAKAAEALAAAEQAAMLDPQSVAAQALLARLLIDNGLGVEALAPVRKAIALAPDNMELRSRELFLMNLDEERAERTPCSSTICGREPARAIGAATLRRYLEGKAEPQQASCASGLSRAISASTRQPVPAARSGAQGPHDIRIVCYSRVEAQDHITQRIRGLGRPLGGCFVDDQPGAGRCDPCRLESTSWSTLQGHTGNYALPGYCEQPAPVQARLDGVSEYQRPHAHPVPPVRLARRPAGTVRDLHTEELVALTVSQWCYRPFFETPLQAEAPHVRNGVDHVRFVQCRDRK
jgi:hypothetical protein